jgi:regulator of protease activity HflC (stomatin/prohibitin superfamily)
MRGFALQGAIVTALIVFVAVTTIAYTFGVVVPPGAMGIRQVMLGPAQGFSAEALPPGYHWSIPMYSRVHVLPATVRVIDMHRDNPENAPGGFPALEIKTTDGATVEIDVSILNRLLTKAGSEQATFNDKVETLEHGGPTDLITKIGLADRQWDERINTIASGELRRSLGRLSTADFYNPKARMAAVLDALHNTRRELAPFGIRIESILLRRYTYESERINDAIFGKNLQEVEERLNAAKSLFAKAAAELADVEAKLDAEIRTTRMRGENAATVLRSEGDLLEAQKRAEADLLVAKAQAEVDRLRAGALTRVGAANLLAAREMAPIIDSLRGGIVVGLDPFDPQQWLTRLSGGPEKRS